MKNRITIAILLCAFASAQVKLEGPPQPHVVNAKLQTRNVANGLDATIREIAKSTQQPLWVGYAVPMIPKPRFICCFEDLDQMKSLKGCCSGCKLEHRGGSFFDSHGGTCVNSTPPTHVFVLFRISGGQVEKVRPFTPDCALDASGLPFVWLNQVNSKESLSYLEKLIAREDRHISDEAIDAIALHADVAADEILERLITAANPYSTREHAAFWLGSQRGRAGFLALRNAARTDGDEKFREDATFAISESSEPEAIPELIRMAHQDRSSKVRGQALFWLAQKASQQAASAITDVVENDPDLELKKKAVFALSEIPKDEGVPLLIKYARTHKNPAVRKEAIFWLGQSEDPRALAFLEDFLTEKP